MRDFLMRQLIGVVFQRITITTSVERKFAHFRTDTITDDTHTETFRTYTQHVCVSILLKLRTRNESYVSHKKVSC